jgi:hypothetical protein
MFRLETLRTALERWSRDPALVQTLRAGWAIDLPGEIFHQALATGRGLAVNVTAHKVLLQLRHGSQTCEFAVPLAALTDLAAFEKWIRAIRTRAEQRLDYEHTGSPPPEVRSDTEDRSDHWEPIDEPCNHQSR